MDIKQVQFDTMIHYYTDRLISLGCSNDLESYFFESLSIYRSNEVEVCIYITIYYYYALLTLSFYY